MFLPRLGLSAVRHIPCFWIGSFDISPLQYAKMLYAMRGYSFKKLKDGTFLVRSKDVSLHLGSQYAAMMLVEWSEWKAFYLPEGGLAGKVVLDAGAGCGETAYFFLKCGAAKVIAIEPDGEAFKLLDENIARNKWEGMVVPLNRPFNLSDMEGKCDFLKIDIEGGEQALIDAKIKPNRDYCIEIHPSVLGAEGTQTLITMLGPTLRTVVRGRQTWVTGSA